MDQNHVFLNEFSIPNRAEDFLLESEMTGWQPFSTPNKFHMQKQFQNSQVPKRYQLNNENGRQGFLEQQNQVIRRLTPSSDSKKAERSENIGNTDFLSAIPHARQSKTVKRKLSYEDERAARAKESAQNPKTYFPFEFIGHATRQRGASLEDSVKTSNEIEARLINPATVTGHALRRPDSNGSIYHTAFTAQSETPLPPRKRRKQFSSNKKSNSTVALEQHFEQIRRKHAEFNWDIPDSQSTVKDEGLSSTDIDIQRVPTTPFFEQYTAASPSLYSTNDTPLQTSMSWIPAASSVPRFGLGMQQFEGRRPQRFDMEPQSSGEPWSANISRTREFSGNHRNATNEVERHLYPY